jgi:hypothetical protein
MSVLKTSVIDLCMFLKALSVTPRNLLSSRSKGFELAGSENLSAKSRTWTRH